MRLWVAAAIVLAVTQVAAAQTVGDLAARGVCSTAGSEGLNAQLIEDHQCFHPGELVELSHAGITLGSSRVYPLATVEARDRLHAAADATPLVLTSAFRTLPQQFVLYESGACALAAEPGSSDHESGRAVDVDNWTEARDAMLGVGCMHPFPTDDPVHFECGGPDLRMASVRTFQRLWNANNPGDRIAEDGIYGPETRMRVQMSPASGFAANACDAGPPEEVDAGADGGFEVADGAVRVYREPTGGCACSTAGRSRGLPVVPLLLVLVLLRRPRAALGSRP